MLLPLQWPETLMCPSWALVVGRRVQCCRPIHRPATGATCLDYHHADLPVLGREAWTDDEEGRELRGPPPPWMACVEGS